jgi:succinoglycan biosynthesis protein ExoA
MPIQCGAALAAGRPTVAVPRARLPELPGQRPKRGPRVDRRAGDLEQGAVRTIEGPPDPLVSVVIPAVNEEQTIGDAIGPFLAESAPGGLEVIVAVAPSRDRTLAVVEAIASRDPRVRVVLNDAGVTPAGLNAAITASLGDVILRMDGHAIPQPGYVAACLAALTSSGAWNVGGAQRKTGRTPAARAAAAATTSSFGIGGGRHHLATEATDVETVWLGCWPRWVFEKIGLFDPEMVRNQDDELNQRIRDAGGRIRFDPSIAALYVSRASWRGLIRQHFGYGLYKVRGIQKRPRLLRPRHLAPAAFVGAVVGAGALSLVHASGAILALGVVIAAWSGAAVLAARRVAGRYGATTPGVVAAYACIHVGYGTGMWAGLIRFAHRWVVARAGSVPTLAPRRAPAGPPMTQANQG